jgi:hypothetical protein
MEDKVVNLIIAVNWVASVFRLHLRILEELDHFVEMRDRSYRNMGVLIWHLSLSFADCRECRYLSVIEARWLTKVLQPDILRYGPVEFC